MVQISSLLAAGRTISIELWPPRTEEAEVRLARSLDRLLALHPSFASITYGAAGSTRDRTHDLVVQLERAGQMTPMAHLVTAAHRRSELEEILTRYIDAGVTNVLALRGDRPLNSARPLPEGELVHAIELVELAKSIGPFCVAVAAHPEGHPDAHDRTVDRHHLAEKLRVADFAITQFFFRIEDYLSLVEDLSDLGLDKPVIPGIMPITNAQTLTRMAELSGCELPNDLIARVESFGDDRASIVSLGIEVATELCEKLLSEGAPGLHFYTMNQTRATLEICANLGVGPN